MSAAVIHVASFIINPDPRLLASAPLPRTALRPRNWPLETRRWYSQLSSQELSSFSSVFSIYIIYNRPLQSTQANGIANTTQTLQLEPHPSLTLNLPHSRVAWLPQVPQTKLEIPQTPEEVSKILFAQRASTVDSVELVTPWHLPARHRPPSPDPGQGLTAGARTIAIRSKTISVGVGAGPGWSPRHDLSLYNKLLF